MNRDKENEQCGVVFALREQKQGSDSVIKALEEYIDTLRENQDAFFTQMSVYDHFLQERHPELLKEFIEYVYADTSICREEKKGMVDIFYDNGIDVSQIAGASQDFED